MQRRAISSILSTFPSSVFIACLASNARCQSLDAILNSAEKAHRDLAVSHVAQKIKRPSALRQGRRANGMPVNGALLNITEQARKAIENRRFRPAQRDGKPVPARVPIEITFRLF
jgi:hypothetical protein